MSRSEPDRVLPSTVHATAARQSGAIEALDTLDRLQNLQAFDRKTAADFLGVPLEDFRGDVDLDDRLGQRLAFFHGQGASDGIAALPYQLTGLPQHPAALVGGGVAP